MKKKKLMKKQSYFVVLLMLLLLFPSGAFAQQQMIKGQVVDDKGDTVIGATVMLKGTQEGAITDIDGNFSIKGKVGNTLTISYVGFSVLVELSYAIGIAQPLSIYVDTYRSPRPAALEGMTDGEIARRIGRLFDLPIIPPALPLSAFI